MGVNFETTNVKSMNLAHNIIGFHHVSIKANQFESTVEFYKNLGFEPLHSWSLPEINMEKCTMLYHKAIHFYLEICDKNAAMPTQGRKRNAEDEYVENALLHICFVVKDAELARQQALGYGALDLSHGVAEVALKSDIKTVHVQNSLVYSPNGEVIEFLEQVDFA